MPQRVVDIQSTPNPNARKFVLDCPMSQESASFFDAESARNHPLASKLFTIDGVTSVLIVADFVTINKSESAKWNVLTEKVRRILMEA